MRTPGRPLPRLASTLVALALGLLGTSNGWAAAKTLYVAPQGNDAWSGTLAEPNAAGTDGPLASLERARDRVRQAKQQGGLPDGGVAIVLRGGRYERSTPLELSAEDAGTEAAPIEYRAAEGETVILSGGRLLSGFAAVRDPAVLARLDESARGHVVQCDLRALGIADLGQVTSNRLELYFQDKPMTLSRWPNEGFAQIVDLVGGEPTEIFTIKGDKIGKFTYEGDRPQRWTQESDAWLHGYWFWDWAEQRQKIASIDLDKHILAVEPPYHSYGYRKGQWFYAFNLLSEIDAPGEWYLDRTSGILYFWPPAPIDQGQAMVSLAPGLLRMKDASYVTVRGWILDGTRDTAVVIEGGTHDQIVGCTLRNLGESALSISGGTRHGVVGCELYQLGGGGLSLGGGDRATLTPAEHVAENNHIHDYSRWNRVYQPAIALHGVGLRAAHNLIHDAPHMAIGFSGNDHVIEFNEIHHVCLESNDAGAIYTGRDWTMRGTVVRYNYLHDLLGFREKGCAGVYLDDMFCGTTVFGNVFVNVVRPLLIGGGRDNVVENNIFVDCKPTLHLDGRALNWAAECANTTMIERLKAVPYQGALWSQRYPQLAHILDDEPAAPKGNVVVRNVVVGGQWDAVEGVARPFVTLQDNLVDEDPHFVDRAAGNYQLRDDSPVYSKLPGFQKIPWEQIGLEKLGDK